MCEKTVNDYPSTSRFVPDWFITPKKFKELVYNDNLVENIYNARHTKKCRERAKPIACYPSRWLIWGWPENEKKEKNKFLGE